jgi:hypothetical protein
MRYDATLASQMIEAAQISGWDTAKHFLVKINRAFKAVCRANQKNNGLIAWEELYTAEKKFRAEERIVILTRTLAQFCNLGPHRQDGSMAA